MPNLEVVLDGPITTIPSIELPHPPTSKYHPCNGIITFDWPRGLPLPDLDGSVFKIAPYKSFPLKFFAMKSAATNARESLPTHRIPAKPSIVGSMATHRSSMPTYAVHSRSATQRTAFSTSPSVAFLSALWKRKQLPRNSKVRTFKVKEYFLNLDGSQGYDACKCIADEVEDTLWKDLAFREHPLVILRSLLLVPTSSLILVGSTRLWTSSGHISIEDSSGVRGAFLFQ